MLKNYLLIASRSLIRHKFFTTINVVGLAIGMSISLLLVAMLSFLWRYDDFHLNKDRIYRVITKIKNPNQTDVFASAPAPLAQQIQDAYPSIEQVVRVNSSLSTDVVDGSNQISIKGYFVDPNFLKVFTFPTTKGDERTSLQKPNTIVITQSAALKVFGTEEAIGRVITLKGIGMVEVTGVLKNHPKNSHLQFEVLCSYVTLQNFNRDNPHKESLTQSWISFNNSYVYLLLPSNSKNEIGNIERFMNREVGKISLEKGNSENFELQALLDIAPGRELRNQIGPEWAYSSLGLFVFFTILILMPACFNYANISISRAIKRMKEIGIRKTMGGQQHQIFTQFVVETVVTTLLALVLSYFIFSIVRTEFVSMMVNPKGLELNPDLPTIFYFILFAAFVGFLTGVVPATYFGRMNPIQALKGKAVGKSKKFTFRKVLIVGQFAMSLGFIMSVVIVLNQYRHSLNSDFGFDQENIFDVELQGVDPQLFTNQFSKLSSVKTISMSSGIPGTSFSGSVWVNKANQIDSLEVFQLFVDDEFIPNLNLELIAGTNFLAKEPNRNHVIVNEEFLRSFGFTDNLSALGASFALSDNQEATIVGIVKNFHYMNLREPIKSFFFRNDPKEFRYANLKIRSKDMVSTIAEMSALWQPLGGDRKFEGQFLDEEIKEAYSFYFSIIKIFGFMGILAISISCLGLLGMVVFTVENKTKEVGIRKVMGASVASITIALSKDFIKLMLVAAIIATPLTYLFFDQVYLKVQYHSVNIGALEIIVSLLVMLILGLATVLSQTVSAARANPIETLRYE
jgi:putative ABC transport system permease protein